MKFRYTEGPDIFALGSTGSTRNVAVLALVDVVKNNLGVVGSANGVWRGGELAQELVRFDAGFETRRVRVNLRRRAGRHRGAGGGEGRAEDWEPVRQRRKRAADFIGGNT